MSAVNTAAACCLGVVLSFGAAHAAPVPINTTYDLTNGTIGITPLTNGAVSIANGDSVVLTVSFTGGLGVTIGDGGEDFAGWLFAGDNDSIFTIDNASIEFLGFSGTGGASSSYSVGSVSDGAAHIGPRLQDFLSAGQSVTFTGYRVTYDVQSISQSPHDYAHLFFFALGDDVRVVGSVPEPPSVILLGIGLSVLWALRRRMGVRPARSPEMALRDGETSGACHP